MSIKIRLWIKQKGIYITPDIIPRPLSVLQDRPMTEESMLFLHQAVQIENEEFHGNLQQQKRLVNKT